jgi:hypothetical protein
MCAARAVKTFTVTASLLVVGASRVVTTVHLKVTAMRVVAAEAGGAAAWRSVIATAVVVVVAAMAVVVVGSFYRRAEAAATACIPSIGRR